MRNHDSTRKHRSNRPSENESAPTTEEQYPAAKAARDNAVPLRERDESRKQAQAPLTAPGKIAEQATALADKKLSAGLQAPPATPAPAAAPAASVAAPKKSARALFYGEPSPRADTGSLAQESKQAKQLGQVKPLGLRYSFVTRGPDGQSREVSAAIAAGSKEPVRITVETTQDAYLQILQNLGSAGTRLWWPPQETGKISLKLPEGKRSEIPLPPPAENGLLALTIRLSPKPFGPLTMQEVGMLDRFSANLLVESSSPADTSGRTGTGHLRRESRGITHRPARRRYSNQSVIRAIPYLHKPPSRIKPEHQQA
jgi:hypothetical protein